MRPRPPTPGPRPRLLAVAACALLPAAAQAERAIAVSPRLGVEVFADDDWCTRRPVLRVVAPDAATFSRAEFLAAMQRLGAAVLGQGCPASASVSLQGGVRGAAPVGHAPVWYAPVWYATADRAEAWVPRTRPERVAAAAPVDLDAAPTPGAVPAPRRAAGQDPTPPRADLHAAAPAAEPGAAGSSRPVAGLGGEWAGELNCDGTSHALVVSVFEVDGARVGAVLQIGGRPEAGQARWLTEGLFDAPSGQFRLEPKAAIRSGPRDPDPVEGTLEPDGTVTVDGAGICGWGKAGATLRRTSQAAPLAARVRDDETRRAAWIAEAEPRARAGRLVGAAPAGLLREPACEDLLAWAAGVPTQVRVRLPGGGYDISRHYDDAQSARVFGSPAFHWVRSLAPAGSDGEAEPADIAQRACPAQVRAADPRWQALSRVVRDRDSLDALGARREVERRVQRLPVLLATTGGTAAEGYADLGRLLRADALRAAVRDWVQVDPDRLSPANLAYLRSEAARLRRLLAARASEEVAAVLAALPDTERGMAEADALAARLGHEFGPDDAAPRAAVEARRRAMAPAVLDAGLAELSALARTPDGLETARRRAAALDARLVPDLPEARARLAAAFGAVRAEVQEAALAAGLAELAAAQRTLDGMGRARARAASLKAGLSDMPDAAARTDRVLAAFEERACDDALGGEPPTPGEARAVLARADAMARGLGAPLPPRCAAHRKTAEARLAKAPASAHAAVRRPIDAPHRPR